MGVRKGVSRFTARQVRGFEGRDFGPNNNNGSDSHLGTCNHQSHLYPVQTQSNLTTGKKKLQLTAEFIYFCAIIYFFSFMNKEKSLTNKT